MEQFNYWHWTEIVLIASILIAQFVIFIRICKKTKAFEKLFADRLGIEDDEEYQVPKVVVYDEKDKIIENAPIQNAIDNINTYIDNNWGGSVNFSIVENIIERESSARDEEIQHLIPTPLYMGLAATMIGIILGLFSMGKIGGNMELNEIDNLISGVKIAMIASLFGLFWTTLLSTWIYKKTKTNVNFCKNRNLNFLQSELLLPTEDNTLTGIRDCIDNFSRTIGHSITELTALAEMNDGIAREIKDSTVTQEHILKEIQEFKPAKVTKVLTDLFTRVDANMEAYREFSQYLGMMSEITAKMASFAERTHNIEEIANELKNNLNESRNLFHFLSEHMRGVENIGQQSLEAINAADSHFNQAIGQLDREMTARVQALSNSTNAFDSKIREIFDQVGKELQEISRAHIELLSNAYHDSLPEFQRLEKLNELDAISEKLDGVGQIKNIEQERSEQIQKVIAPLTCIERKNETQGQSLISAIKELGSRLEKIEKNTDGTQLRDRQGLMNQPNKDHPQAPKRRFLTILLLVLVIAVSASSFLTCFYIYRMIGDLKSERAERLQAEFDQELAKINYETPLLCEKYRLVSLEESVDVPEAWKVDSLRYRQQLDRFWKYDSFRQRVVATINNQKQTIKSSRQQNLDYLNALMLEETGPGEGDSEE